MVDNLEKYTFPCGTFASGAASLLSTQTFLNGNVTNATSQLLLLVPHLPFFQWILYSRGIQMCEKLPGVYSRQPLSNDNTSVDDYLAIGCDKDCANRILTSARSNLGFVDIHNSRPRNWAQFIFRFQGLWQHLKVSADESVGPIGRLIWAVSIVMAAKQPFTNQDSWSQSHMMIIVKERRGFKSFICDLAIKYWRKKKTMTTSDMMAAYIGDPDHPLVQAWRIYN